MEKPELEDVLGEDDGELYYWQKTFLWYAIISTTTPFIGALVDSYFIEMTPQKTRLFIDGMNEGTISNLFCKVLV